MLNTSNTSINVLERHVSLRISVTEALIESMSIDWRLRVTESLDKAIAEKNWMLVGDLEFTRVQELLEEDSIQEIRSFDVQGKVLSVSPTIH